MTDRPPPYFRLAFGGLVPASEAAEELLAKLKPGQVVRADVAKPTARSLRQHRLYWALCQRVAENSEALASAEQVSDLLKLSVGHCQLFEDAKGQVWKTPRSIAFASMPHDEFCTFMDQVIRVVVERILPGVDEDDLRREIEEMIADRRHAA